MSADINADFRGLILKTSFVPIHFKINCNLQIQLFRNHLLDQGRFIL